MKFDVNNTYWNDNGLHEDVAKKYINLIPEKGRAADKHIECLRCISNIYYYTHSYGVEGLKINKNKIERWLSVLENENGLTKNSIKQLQDLKLQFKQLYKNKKIKKSAEENLLESLENLLNSIFEIIDSNNIIENYTDDKEEPGEEISLLTLKKHSKSRFSGLPENRSELSVSSDLKNLDIPTESEALKVCSNKKNADLYIFLMSFSLKKFNQNDVGRGNAFKNAAKTISELKVSASSLFKSGKPQPKLKYIGDYMYNIILEYYS